MKIAYICCDFGVPIFGYKGASIHVREMIEAFRRAGHSVSISSPAMDTTKSGELNHFKSSENLPDVALRPIGAEERHLKLMKEFEKLDKFLGIKTRIRQEIRNLFYNMTIYENVIEELRAQQIDFVYERYTLFSHAGIALAKELGVPHILEVNSPLAYEQEKMRGLEMKEFAGNSEKRIYQETDQVLAVSQHMKNFVSSCGVPDERIEVLPNSVDPVRFEAALTEGGAIREKYKIGNKCVIGFVGSLKPWHGTETLLQAFRQIVERKSNAHVLLVGDGPTRDALESYVSEYDLSDRVTFTGKVKYEEIPRYIAAMDIAAAPYTPNDNFYYSPIKIFEYMIMGKAVIAGSIGQVEDIIADDETGRLFEPGNVGNLAEVLADLIDHPDKCQELGKKCQSLGKARTHMG